MNVLGADQEHRLLDALLRDNRQAPLVLGRVTSAEFSHPSVGAVFDGVMAALGRGQAVTQISVADHFVDWQATGIGPADPFVWSKADTVAADAPLYADRIRAAYLRMAAMTVANDLMSEARDGAADPVITLGRASERVTALLDGTTSEGIQTRTLADVLTTEDQYDWVIPDLLERADRLVVTGNEGGGKTTFLRQLALCVAGGMHPMDQRRTIEPKRVLVIDAENTERQWRRETRWMVNRINQLGVHRNPAPHIDLHTTRRLDLTRAGDMTRVHQLLDDTRPDMVMIGPLYRLVPRAITNDDDAAPLIAALDQIRDRGITLVMEAHAGKANDAAGDRDMRPRGSSALLGWPEFGFGIRPSSVDDPNVVSLVPWRGGRDGSRVWPKHLYRGGDLPWTPSD